MVEPVARSKLQAFTLPVRLRGTLAHCFYLVTSARGRMIRDCASDDSFSLAESCAKGRGVGRRSSPKNASLVRTYLYGDNYHRRLAPLSSYALYRTRSAFKILENSIFSFPRESISKQYPYLCSLPSCLGLSLLLPSSEQLTYVLSKKTPYPTLSRATSSHLQ